MHDENFQDVQRLIALKQHEQPGDAYFEEFLDEFHRRQRQELLQRSSRSLFMERVSTWFSGGNKTRIFYGAGLAYAAAFFAAILFWPGTSDTAAPQIETIPVKHTLEKKDMLQPDKDKAPVREAY